MTDSNIEQSLIKNDGILAVFLPEKVGNDNNYSNLVL